MTPSRRQFLTLAGRSLAAGALSFETVEAVARGAVAPGTVGLALETQPTTGKPFRMTEAWYRQQIRHLQERLAERGLNGLILADPHNLNYLTGLFLTQTERPAWVWVPVRGEPAIFGPGLDRDMYADWWIKDFEWYFDYPHAGPMGRVVFEKGPRVDLRTWLLRGIAQRGGGDGKIGVEGELPPSAHKAMLAVLPKAEFVPAGDLVLAMRMRKTPEEIALTQVALDYHDRTLEFARNLIAEKGIGMLDAEVRRASEEFAEGLVFRDYEPTGRAHTAVGFALGLNCRAGVATAYPHPNQYFYKRIARGDAVQIAGVLRIGGYGGEGYRALHIEPMPDLARKMWEVHTEMVLAQEEYSRPGVECREVAEKVLQIARRAGLEQYVYHRPAHGQGMEGHQPPYIALGDETVLEDGMMFSNEPGLYNLKGGYGYNHSNLIVITKTGARRMNRAPLTKEFCWIGSRS